MTERREGKSEEFRELPDDGAVAWTITKALLEASDATSRALEMHLMQTQYDADADTDTASITQYIDAAIEQHQQIIEDLRLARDGLDYDGTQ
ncbi:MULTISPECIES: hypothetical protein [Haloferax]|uniref:DUF8103 domain-containing protein n=2 Tax=Haloferax TaxID=2251 RepID=A0A6G1Z0E9_9EURY|nr:MULTISPECIES: hypothetical protein [Haloferax]KAB1187465.1 hypothetical protein Hfx1149_05245 [Haloferax sp. CBA1149]MRW80117.1 hypothetical protein [Haloferax marinisediminis]